MGQARAAELNRGGGSAAQRISTERSTYIAIALFLVCLAAQLYLVFFKSFNWDEFLHFSFVYAIKDGTYNPPFQSLHLRALWWAPEVAADLLDQMLAARLFMWGMHLVTLLMIYGVARQFTNVANSFFAAFAYLTAGYVFTQGFAVRADPFVTAVLTCALFLFAKGPLGTAKALVIGVLIGLAGMMTFKAAFYAPCFAGLAWLKSRETPGKLQYCGKLALVLIAALATFGSIYLYYGSSPAGPARPGQGRAHLSVYLHWLSEGMPFAIYSVREFVRAPLFFLSLAFAPLAWRASRLKSDEKIALAGFVVPLTALFFYRNTFPYFFVFILAPPAIAIAPALGWLRDRVGSAPLGVALSAIPLTMAVMEPRDVIGRQRALIDYVHREYPKGTGYLDYSGMIADYPRILRYLTSGNGIRGYHEQGDAVVAREIARGNVPFIIANHPVISEALQGRPVPGTFQPDDVAAMMGSYVQQWGVLWREGEYIPAGSEPFDLDIRRGGIFVANRTLNMDGHDLAPGAAIQLSEGRHLVAGGRDGPSILWRNKLPTPPPDIAMDRVFTNF